MMAAAPVLAGETPPPREVLCRKTAACFLTLVARLPHAPFPYDGPGGDGETPFFDQRDEASGQLFHTVTDGLAYPESPHYRDDRVLIHLPPGFKPDKPFELLVFFHGHQSELLRTLVGEMALTEQVNAARRNLVLVAPQLVLDAADSSPGKLYQPQALTHLLGDVGRVLGRELGKGFAGRCDKAPVILTAYSGGYRALAYALDRGFTGKRQARSRVRGVILMDALYGEMAKFDAWLRQPGRGFFVNLYGPSSEELSRVLEEELRQQGRRWSPVLKERLKPAETYSLNTTTPHETIFLDGPPVWPLTAMLKQLGKSDTK